ncbi:MAG TPA: hypothetical protein VGI41_00115 [Candidatus Udaeobacter sp.]|jgi:hypothetical protein
MIHRFRKFVADHGLLRFVERKTYVFIFVPFDSSQFGGVKRAEVAQPLLNGHNGSVTEHELRSSVPQRSRDEVIGSSVDPCDTDAQEEPELDFRLMWTWFLPNPLWSPNKSKSNFTNLFRFGLNGFSANKTRRNN